MLTSVRRLPLNRALQTRLRKRFLRKMYNYDNHRVSVPVPVAIARSSTRPTIWDDLLIDKETVHGQVRYRIDSTEAMSARLYALRSNTGITGQEDHWSSGFNARPLSTGVVN